MGWEASDEDGSEGRWSRLANSLGMEGTVRGSAWPSELRSQGAIVACLLLIVLALLGIGNEIRFQGCVGRQDRKALVAATENPRSPSPVLLECHRLPFK
jgi:hypothetical protein